MPGWLVLNIYSFIISVLLYAYSNKYGVKFVKQLKMFNGLLGLLIALLVFDSLGRLSGNTEISLILLRIGNFGIFFFDPFIGFCIIKYIDSWAEQKYKMQQVLVEVVRLVVILNSLLIILQSAFNTKWFYYFENGHYMRGSFFVPRAAIVLALCFIVEAYAIVYKDLINKQYYGTIKIFPLIPFVFGILQIFINGYAFEYTGMTLACVIIFIHIQEKYLSVDQLTNLANRKVFDDTYEQKVTRFNISGKKFSIFMMDLDKFKSINDNYGHNTGDLALMQVSDILKNTFDRKDVICRFGGDEFCILSDIDTEEQIEEVKTNIKKLLKEFNSKSDTYKLGLSIGSVIYDSNHKTGNEYIKIADEMMYKEKKHKKAKKVAI